MEKMKIFIIVLFLLGYWIVSARNTYAFINTEGSSAIVPDFRIYVNGIQPDSAEKKLIIKTNNPTFFGYGDDKEKINFMIQPGAISHTIIPDATGYWVFSLKQPLAANTYKLFVSFSNGRGIKSAPKLAATFQVPPGVENNNSSIVIPKPSLQKLNYFTVSLIIFCFVMLLILFYLFAKRHRYFEE